MASTPDGEGGREQLHFSCFGTSLEQHLAELRLQIMRLYEVEVEALRQDNYALQAELVSSAKQIIRLQQGSEQHSVGTSSPCSCRKSVTAHSLNMDQVRLDTRREDRSETQTSEISSCFCAGMAPAVALPGMMTHISSAATSASTPHFAGGARPPTSPCKTSSDTPSVSAATEAAQVQFAMQQHSPSASPSAPPQSRPAKEGSATGVVEENRPHPYVSMRTSSGPLAVFSSAAGSAGSSFAPRGSNSGGPEANAASMSRASSKCSAMDLIETGERFLVSDTWIRPEVNTRKQTQSWESVGPSPRPFSPRRKSADGSFAASILSPADWLCTKCMVHPTSKKRFLWDIMSFILVVADVAIMPMYVFTLSITAWTGAFCWVSRIFWLLDIFASFITGTYINGSLELRSSAVSRHFAKTWFMPDFLTCCVQWLPLVMACSTTHRSLMVFLCAARVIRLFRLLRQLKVRMVLHEIGSRFSYNTALTIMGLFKFITYSAIGIHFIACSWYAIGRSRLDGWVYEYNFESASVLTTYMRSVNWSLAQFHGSSNIHPCNLQETTFANVVMSVGLILLCYLVGVITNMLIQLEHERSSEIRQQRVLCGFIKHYRISAALSVKARAYFDMHCRNKHEEQLQADESKAVLAMLPPSIQLDIDEEVRGPVIINFSFLSDITEENPRIVRQLCHEALVEEVVQASDMIFTTGDVCSRMLFVMNGTVGYTLLRRPSSSPRPSRFCTPAGMISEDACATSSMLLRGSVRQDISIAEDQEKDYQACDGGWATCANLSLVPQRSSSRSPSDANCSDVILNCGEWVSEAVLWTAWEYCGELCAVVNTTLLAMDAAAFAAVISRHASAFLYATRYARIFVKRLNHCEECSDVLRFHLVKSAVLSESEQAARSSGGEDSLFDHFFQGRVKSIASIKRSIRRLEPVGRDASSHYVFISHHKAAAGTEAALMQEALERMIHEDLSSPGHHLKAPVFLDSEDLADLNQLKEHVRKSCNLVVLLTNEVLTRPWVLVEIVTAQKAGLQIVPVEVQKKDLSFDYPDEAFFQKLRAGNFLSQDAMRLLLTEGITTEDLEKAVRKVFMKIAVPFSPHKSPNVRDAELRDILRRCQDVPELS